MIRIFIGSETKTRIMEQVLRYSITKRTKEEIEFTSMDGIGWEIPTDLPRGTGFSLRRWLIPEKCNFQGKAIYLDADILCFADIAELWNFPLQGSSCAMTYQPDKFKKEPWPQSSVMLIDCVLAQKQWHSDVMWVKLRRSAISYPDLMHGSWLSPQPAILPTVWNGLNEFKPNQTKLLHYTREPLQPPYRPDLPLAGLWMEVLEEAIKAGAVNEADFRYGLDRWGMTEDWRKQNGIHPAFRNYLQFFTKQS